MAGLKSPISNLGTGTPPKEPRKLFGRFWVWPYLFLVVALVVAFAWGYTQNRNYVTETFQLDQKHDAQLVAGLLSSTIGDMFKHLRYLATDYDVINMTRVGRDQLQQVLNTEQQKIQAVTRISPSMQITYTYPDESAIGNDLSAQLHNQLMVELQEEMISSPFLAVQGYEAVSVAVPVFSRDKFEGSLAVLLDFQNIVDDALLPLGLSESKSVLLLDSKGMVIYSSFAGQVGRVGSEVFADRPGMLDLISQMQTSQTGTAEVFGGFDQGQDSNKKPVLVAYTSARLTSSNNWSICIAAEKTAVLERLAPTKLPFTVAAVFAIFVFLVAIAFVQVSSKYKKILEQDVRARTVDLQKSEEKHRVLIESLAEGIVVTDAQGFIDLVNPAMEKILGQSIHALLGTKLSDYLAPGQLPEFLSQQALLQLGKEINFELKTTSQSGELRDLLISAKPKLSSQRKYLGATLFIQNFTKRKRAEELLKQERQVFLGGPVVVFKWVAKADWPVDFVSPNVAQFGYSVEQWLSGKISLPSIIHSDDLLRVTQEVQTFSKSGVNTFEQEYRIIQGDGRVRWVYDFTSVVRNNEGEITHYLGYIFDTTEVKRASLIQEVLLDIAEAHAQTEDLETLVSEIRHLLGKLIDTTNFYVALFDPTVGLYTFPYSVDEKDKNFKPQPLRFSLTDYVRRTGEPLFSTEEVHLKLEAEGMIHTTGPQAPVWLGAPLKSATGIIGVVAVQHYTNPKNYEPSDMELLAYVSDHIALAIERKRAETALSKSEASYRTLVEVAQESIITVDEYEIITFTNDAFCKALGFSKEEILGHSLVELADTESGSNIVKGTTDRKQGRIDSYEIRFIAKNGEFKDFISTSSPLAAEDGTYQGSMAVMVDITKRKKSESMMLHTQKLESLGILASGIAHDFNNLLVGILGNSALALSEIDKSSRVHTYITDVEKAAKRAADLTQQLLAYSGKGNFIVESTDLCELVVEMGALLGSAVSSKVTLKYNLDKSIAPIQADAAQIRQVIMNMILNAAESVGEEDGIVIVSVGKQHADANYLKSRFITGAPKAGEYAYVEVSDNGLGMNQETLSKIFDPFYTTKLTGRGLGLAAVLGIIKGHKGTIKVYSKVGQGSSFRFMLPFETVQARPPKLAADTNYQGTGTVLLIDDEPTIRTVGSRILSKMGFEVVCAADGVEGLELFCADPNWYDIVVLDLTMPRMDGEEVLARLHKIKPDIKVLIMSGYSGDEFEGKFTDMNYVGFLQKPFSPNVLLEKVGQILSWKPQPGPPPS